MLEENILALLWRFFSGAHMDGRRYTDATWFKRGKFPKAHLNWWSVKPRAHRAAIRIGVVAIPVVWGLLLAHFRYWTSVVTLAAIPYSVHYGWQFIYHRIRFSTPMYRGKETKGSVTIPGHFEPEEETNITDMTFPPPEVKTRKAK